LSRIIGSNKLIGSNKVVGWRGVAGRLRLIGRRGAVREYRVSHKAAMGAVRKTGFETAMEDAQEAIASQPEKWPCS
jgi:hypothetical protein